MSQETSRRGEGGVRSGVGATLVEVAHQQVGAAGVAAFADLGQQMRDRHTGLFNQAASQVLAVGVDQSGAVLRRAQEIVGRGGAGVAFDRIESPAQAPSALAQSESLLEEGVDLGVLAAGSFGERTGATRACCVPAAAVCDHGLLHRGGQAVPQMPPVADLHR
ncbi:hypothetical protein, partial [Nonomuraea dietziae]|uniref:hypothetical protein n=1 Tax=Nonomuraea dietziae TaxID=65515 RepID=UPI003329E980